jgi:hypothetical protein
MAYTGDVTINIKSEDEVQVKADSFRPELNSALALTANIKSIVIDCEEDRDKQLDQVNEQPV